MVVENKQFGAVNLSKNFFHSEISKEEELKSLQVFIAKQLQIEPVLKNIGYQMIAIVGRPEI